MKLNELVDTNTPQIKVSMCRRRGGSKQALILSHLSKNNAVEQVHQTVQRIMAKYLATDPAEYSVKLVEREPVIFNIISPTAEQYFQVVVSFPEGMEDAQNALITKIGSFLA